MAFSRPVQRPIGVLLWALLAAWSAGSGLAQTTRLQTPVRLDKTQANLWLQTSAEYRAICLQTFRAALAEVRQVVDSAPRQRNRPVSADGLPLAVVADLDETILDNSGYQTELCLKGEGYSETTWRKWVVRNMADLRLVPGAKRFIEETERLGVTLVYISNRPQAEYEATRRALEHLGIDTAGMNREGPSRLWLQEEKPSSGQEPPSSKSKRRRQVAETYHVIAYIGDNLNDFPGETESTLPSRYEKVDAFDALWGSRWFMLPNPVYGDWERALGPNPKDHLHRARDRDFLEPSR
ncbi:MAG: HAD family acid phosphatase [Acidobacteriota bacterium]